MSIYLDGMFYRCSGVGRVYENLLGAFAGTRRRGDPHDRPGLARGEVPRTVPSPDDRADLRRVRPMGFGDLAKKRFPPFPAGKVRIFFFPGHNVPLVVPGRYIVSVNDVTVFSPHFRLPCTARPGFAGSSRGGPRAEAVVTISEAVKEDLVREFRLPPGKIRVIYPWIKESFFEAPPVDAPLPDSLQGEDYILYVGLRIAHKNVEGVIRAFLLLLDDFPKLKLVIAEAGTRSPTWSIGGKGPAPGGEADRDPRPFGRRHRATVRGGEGVRVPSFAEGFGLPPLEAMAAGVPVVCSDIPVFREVYGTPCATWTRTVPSRSRKGSGRSSMNPAGHAPFGRRGGKGTDLPAGKIDPEYLDLVGGRKIGT